MSKGYDEKCFELAEHFIEGEPTIPMDRVDALALRIQQTIEDFLEEQREEANAEAKKAFDAAKGRGE